MLLRWKVFFIVRDHIRKKPTWKLQNKSTVWRVQASLHFLSIATFLAVTNKDKYIGASCKILLTQEMFLFLSILDSFIRLFQK